jgi:hypothetical protein
MGLRGGFDCVEKRSFSTPARKATTVPSHIIANVQTDVSQNKMNTKLYLKTEDHLDT